MKIIIVGSTSFIAVCLKKKLLLDNHEVLLAGRREAEIKLDLLSEHPIDCSQNAEVLIHCAASFFEETDEGIRKNHLTNSVGMVNVVQLVRKAECRHVIYLSSVSAEHDAVTELSSYGLSKYHGESLLTWLCHKYKIKLTILRCSQIYDNFGLAKKHQPFLYFLIKEIANNKKITLYGTTNPLRNYLHVNDLVNCIIKSLKNPLVGNYACINPQSYTVTELIDLICSALKIKPNFVFDQTKPSLALCRFPSYKNSFLERMDYTNPINLGVAAIQIAEKLLAENANV